MVGLDLTTNFKIILESSHIICYSIFKIELFGLHFKCWVLDVMKMLRVL